MLTATIAALSLLASARAQQAGTYYPEEHPPLTIAACTKSDGCVAEKKAVVMDANWRWVHDIEGYTDCYDNGEWDDTLCPDPVACAASCALEGIGRDEGYSETYGVSAVDDPQYAPSGVWYLDSATGASGGGPPVVLDRKRRRAC